MFEKKLKNIPSSPGIYLFYNAKGDLIYVGKATNLKSRVISYFHLSFRPIRLIGGERRNPSKTTDERDSSTSLRSAQNDKSGASRPIEEMIHEVKDIKYKTTGSVLEAIILESIYIKKFQPRYNIKDKDDKSWNYIVITNDEYPQVTTIREHELRLDSRLRGNDKLRFGPYPGLKSREALKILRRLFKFSTCRPPKQSKQIKQSRQTKQENKPCFYRQLGECLGVCTGEITPTDYKQKVIGPIKLFLQGKKERVIKSLEKNMRSAARHQEFEEASRLRNQINALRRLQDMALLNDGFIKDTPQMSFPRKRESSHWIPNQVGNDNGRIEGYDISHISGTSAVGSMVVFTNSEPDKNQYRKFKIRTISQANDVGMLKEVLERRFKNDWPLPQLILIDGGRPQVNTAKDVLQRLNLSIPVVGIAKGPDRKKDEIIGQLANFELKTLIAVRDEAHRFAITYHRKLRSNTLTNFSK